MALHIDIDELLDAIDESTHLVSTSHVLFRSAFIMPARAITAKRRTASARKSSSMAITASA